MTFAAGIVINSNIAIILNVGLCYLNLLLKISDPILQDRNATMPALASQHFQRLKRREKKIPNSLVTILRRIRASDITGPPFSLTVLAWIAAVAFDAETATPITCPRDLLSFRKGL